MIVYLAYSFTQATPKWWEVLGHRFVAVSADNIQGRLERALRELGGLEVLVDSGGFRGVSRGSYPDPRRVIEVQRVLVDGLGALPVVLDYPVKPGASDAEVLAANRATALNARLWSRVFGDRFVYVVHGHTVAQLEEAVRVLLKTAPSVEYVGLGSQAIVSRRRPCQVVRLVEYLAQRLDKRLHVFGTGNSTLLHLAVQGVVFSADTSSPLTDARYGLARHPETFSMAVVAPRRINGSRPRASPEEIASLCSCPVCSSNPDSLSAWGREGHVARAVHNAYWLLRMLEEPEAAVKALRRRC